MEEVKETALTPAVMEQYAQMGIMLPEVMRATKIQAEMYLQSGAIPKHYYETGENTTNKAAKVMVALQYGALLGFRGLIALQNVAVVNGMPTLKGDACKALILNSNLCEEWEEYFEGEGDEKKHVIEAKRAGQKKVKYEFSVGKAKRAGLWITPDDVKANGKLGYKPWYKYPDRMLRYRNLGFISRDVWPDIMQGFVIQEEAEDYPENTMVIHDVEGKEVKIVPTGTEETTAAVEDTVGSDSSTDDGPDMTGVAIVPPVVVEVKWDDSWGIYDDEGLREMNIAELKVVMETRSIPRPAHVKKLTVPAATLLILAHQKACDAKGLISPTPPADEESETPEQSETETNEGDGGDIVEELQAATDLVESLITDTSPRPFQEMKATHDKMVEMDLTDEDVVAACKELELSLVGTKEKMAELGTKEDLVKLFAKFL